LRSRGAERSLVRMDENDTEARVAVALFALAIIIVIAAVVFVRLAGIG
jgi:hypothetical protein